MLSIEFSTKVTQVALDLPSLFKETTLPPPHPESVQIWNYVHVRTVTGRTRKLLAIFCKNELGVCFWSLHSVLITIFFLMFTSRCKDLVHVRNWSLSCRLCCCCCPLGSIKIILNRISSGTTKWVAILCNCPFSFFFFLFFFYHAILLFEISLQTREELREALEAEMRAFAVDKVGHKLSLLFVQFIIWSINQVKKSFKTHTICQRQRLLRSLSIFCKWRGYDVNLLMRRFMEGARTYDGELSFLFWPG